MPALATIGQVRAEVERDGKVTPSCRYSLSPAKLSAAAFARAVCAHSSIENGVHWVLDLTFNEDRARNRKNHGAQNLAIIRKLALNVIKRPKCDSPAPAPPLAKVAMGGEQGSESGLTRGGS